MPGQVYTFTTSPYYDFSSHNTGRIGAFIVLAVTSERVCAGALNQVWTKPPTMRALERAELLTEFRFYHNGGTAAFTTPIERWTPYETLEGVNFHGAIQLSRAQKLEAEVQARGSTGANHANLKFLSTSIEGEWRWANDRHLLVGEQGRKVQADAEKRARKRRD